MLNGELATWSGRMSMTNRRLIIEFVVLALIILSAFYIAGSGIIAIFAEYAPPEKIAAIRSVVGFIFGGAGFLSSLTCLLLYYRERGRIELKSALKKLESANLELARVDGIRSEFMSHVSHELRTPLTSLMESISLVLDGTLGKINDEQGDFLALAHKDVKRLSRMVRGLLDISRIKSGKVELRMCPMNICLVLENVAKDMRREAAKKGIGLKVELPLHPLVVYADPDKIIQILTNLVDNAVKFTPEGGDVRVMAGGGAEGGCVEVVVTDTGSGIAPENLGGVFEEFASFDGGIAERRGAGLGLAITRELVELQGGKIRVESKLGEGSKFTFTVPRYAISLFSAEHLDDEIKRVKKRETRLRFRRMLMMMLVIQVDNFREIYGRERGNEFLRELAKGLNAFVRYPCDLVGAYEDDGVACVLNEVPEDKISAIEKRAKESVIGRRFPGDLDIHQCVVVYPGDGSSGQELLRKIQQKVGRGSG